MKSNCDTFERFTFEFATFSSVYFILDVIKLYTKAVEVYTCN